MICSWWNNSGAHLDSKANDETVRDLLIRRLLKIRVKKGGCAI